MGLPLINLIICRVRVHGAVLNRSDALLVCGGPEDLSVKDCQVLTFLIGLVVCGCVLTMVQSRLRLVWEKNQHETLENLRRKSIKGYLNFFLSHFARSYTSKIQTPSNETIKSEVLNRTADTKNFPQSLRPPNVFQNQKMDAA